MGKDKKAILIGMCLGDGSIKKAVYENRKKNRTSVYGIFSVTHSIKQEEYLKHKAELLGRLLNCKTPKIGRYGGQTAYGWIKSCKINKQHSYFRVIREWLYPGGKKYFSRKILDKLNPQAIAIWYMDDGGTSRRDRKTGWGVEMRISTYFSEEEADTFIQYFQEVWGIQAKKRFSKKTKTYYMAFNTTESLKLEELIQDFIIPSMQYKLPKYWNPRALDTQKSDDIV